MPRRSLPAALCAAALCAGGGFLGCTSGGSGGLADAAAVREAAALPGEPLPIHDWTTDLAAARTQAAAEKKDVLMLFTGSDWCPPCMMLEAQVFGQAPASRLTDDFVPVLLDFPENKPQPAGLAARNAATQERYGVQGYPTVLLTTAAGEKYGELGYQGRYESGGAAAFLADVKALRARHAGTPTDSGEPSVGGAKTAAL